MKYYSEQCICLYGHVFSREDGHMLLEFEVNVQWKKRVEKDVVKVGLTWKDALCRSTLI